MASASDEATACAYTQYDRGEVPEEYPKTGEGADGVEADIWEALYEVEDPEMPVSVVDLGLIYTVEVEETEAGDERAVVEMTLTYSGCPARDMLQNDVRCAALSAGVEAVEVRLRYSPTWNVDMVTEDGREALREFGLSV
ncbi:MAG: 1,2-phenylacetyl-CoA epoxidase subunit PaaD [Halolamina sp.]